jgi:eukaryotic-like serine/threonine-protein kinase
MDEKSSARRKNLELVRNEDQRTTSGVVPASASSDGAGIATGTVIDGKYRVGNIVGAGAVGIVFEAQNLELDEKVAIKCLRPEMLSDKAMVARFGREAKAAAVIKSEYVASVYDVGTTRDGVPYIVMEYLEGKDLGTVVQDSGMLAPRAAVEYALQVCEALAVAHAKGIVHRDIKPENLLLTERSGGIRIVKVLDFGISKAALTGSIFGNEVPLVKTVNLMGTPLYMSPEQVRCSDGVDVRSDIWSLGMVLYEILTGHTAFVGTSITEICAAILEHTPQPITKFRTDVPPGLVAILERCLEKDASKRYQNVAELAMALMPFGPKRARLNVERAVAVLQSSGHVDPGMKVNSTMPPPMADASLVPQVPPAPRTPTEPMPFRVTPLPSLTDATTTTVPADASSAVEIGAPPKKRSSAPSIALALVALAALAGAGALLLKARSELNARNEAGAKAPTTIATTAPTPTSTIAATPGTTAAPVATTTVAPVETTPPPAPAVTQAAAKQTSTTSTATSAAPFMTGVTPAKRAAGTTGAPATSAKAKPGATAAAPSTGKPKSEEPDLGY